MSLSGLHLLGWNERRGCIPRCWRRISSSGRQAKLWKLAVSRDGRVERQVVRKSDHGQPYQRRNEYRQSHFAPLAFGLPASITFAPNFAAFSAPAFGRSGLQCFVGGSPQVRPISAHPTQRPSGPRYPGPPRQPHPLHTSAEAAIKRPNMANAMKKNRICSP